MNHIYQIWNQIDDIFTQITIYREFKSGHRNLLGLDGISLLLMAISAISYLALLSMGLASSKLILPPGLLFLCGSLFLYGDQFLSPGEARILETSAYRTGWSPGYVWFVSLVFASMGGVLIYFWTEIPFRISKTEPCDGQFAVFAQKSPEITKSPLAKSSLPTKVKAAH